MRHMCASRCQAGKHEATLRASSPCTCSPWHLNLHLGPRDKPLPVWQGSIRPSQSNWRAEWCCCLAAPLLLCCLRPCCRPAQPVVPPGPLTEWPRLTLAGHGHQLPLRAPSAGTAFCLCNQTQIVRQPLPGAGYYCACWSCTTSSCLSCLTASASPSPVLAPSLPCCATMHTQMARQLATAALQAVQPPALA